MQKHIGKKNCVIAIVVSNFHIVIPLFSQKYHFGNHLQTHFGENNIKVIRITKFSHIMVLWVIWGHKGGWIYITVGSVTTHSRRSVILWAMWGCSGESPINAAIMPRNSKGNLGSHLRTHSGEKSCQCNLCEKAIFQNSVIIHLKAQIGEKSYHCSQRDKTFA